MVLKVTKYGMEKNEYPSQVKVRSRDPNYLAISEAVRQLEVKLTGLKDDAEIGQQQNIIHAVEREWYKDIVLEEPEYF